MRLGGVPCSLRWLFAFVLEEWTAWEYERVVGGSSSWVRGVAGGVDGPDMFGFAPVNLRPVPPPRGREERPEEAAAGLPYWGLFLRLKKSEKGEKESLDRQVGVSSHFLFQRVASDDPLPKGPLASKLPSRT